MGFNSILFPRVKEQVAGEVSHIYHSLNETRVKGEERLADTSVNVGNR